MTLNSCGFFLFNNLKGFLFWILVHPLLELSNDFHCLYKTSPFISALHTASFDGAGSCVRRDSAPYSCLQAIHVIIHP